MIRFITTFTRLGFFRSGSLSCFHHLIFNQSFFRPLLQPSFRSLCLGLSFPPKPMCFFVSTAAPPLWCVVFMFPASSISVIIPISIGGSLNWCTYLLHKQLVHIGNITSAGQKDKLKKSRCRVREGGQGLLRRSFIGIRAEFPKSPKECKSVSKAEVIGIGFKGRVSGWPQVVGKVTKEEGIG